MVAEIDLGIDELSDFEVIGRGGFSTIYSAQDSGFNRRVAVKLLHSLDDSGRRRFDRERGIMGQLSSHPNVIMPFRAGYARTGAPYLVMELVTGGSLQDLIDTRGGLPWREAVELVLPVTAALGHAHEQGILHRDVKPANVVLAGRVPKLTDFGIAAIRESTTTQVAYTLAHCPPEAFASGEDTRDDRSDLYSMASTLYNLITGRPPYYIDGTDSPQAYMFRIMGHAIPPVSPEVIPPTLWAFLERALAKDPNDRPASAREFEDELRAVLAGEGPAVTAPGPSTGQPGPGWMAAANPTVVSGPGLAPPGPGTSDPTRWAPPQTSGPGTSDPTRWQPDPWSQPGMSQPGVSQPGMSGPGVSQPGVSGPGMSGPAVSAPGLGAPDPGTSGHPGYAPAAFHPGDRPAPARGRGPLVAALAAVAVLVAAVAGAGLWWTSRDSGGPPPLAWQYETGSALASRPAVADGVLVIGATVTNTVHGIDIATGRSRWQYTTGGNVDTSPSIVDGVAYIGSHDGSLYAFDIQTGDVRWQAPLGAEATGSTAVVGDLVVVGTGSGATRALYRADGTDAWTARTGTQLINSTPVIAQRDGADLIVIGSTDGSLYFLDPATGTEVNKVTLEGGIWFSTPLVLDKLGLDGQPTPGRQELWVGTSGEHRGFLNRVDVDTGQVKTFTNNEGVGTNPALTGGGLIVAGNDAGELFAIGRQSLGEAWRHGYADATQIKGSPVVHGDEVIFGTHDKQLIAVSAATGDELWHFDGPQIFGLSAPVIADDRLYVGNDSGTIYAFDL
ncbi:MAG: PQQ-binding-like beta-propeller repeat protein [Acidimicrobiales bacterium]